MVKGASLNVECNLFQEVTCGDHMMLIDEAVGAIHNSEKQSLIYHGAKYWSLEQLIKPNEEESEKVQWILEKYKK